MSSSTATINGIPLSELLSTCIDACHRGCEVIRSVHCRSISTLASAIADDDAHVHTDVTEEAEAAVRETSDGSMTEPPPFQSQRAIAHTFKLATSHNTIDPETQCVVIDPRSALTEADEASQAVILDCLRSCWGEFMVSNVSDGRPRLWIVGEEDDNETSLLDYSAAAAGGQDNNDDVDDLFERYGVDRPNEDGVMMDRHLVQPDPEANRIMNSADNQELIIFIDPLDGTREYIENRIHNVQCLIGITLNGVPIAGAVGLPFGSGGNDQDENLIEVAYGWIMPQSTVDAENVDTKNNDTSHHGVIASGIKHFNAKNKMPTDSSITTRSCNNDGLLSNLTDNDEEDDTLIILSGDSKKPALQITMDCLENDVLRSSAAVAADAAVDTDNDSTSSSLPFSYRKIICGGCGNKILYLGRRHQLISERKRLKRKSQHHVQQQDEVCSKTTTSEESIPIVGTIAISPPGSSSWDTAAPSAVLLSLDPDALVTDLIGRPLVYNGVDLTNVHGVVVSSGDGAVKVHRELCGRLSRNEEFCNVIGVDSRWR